MARGDHDPLNPVNRPPEPPTRRPVLTPQARAVLEREAHELLPLVPNQEVARSVIKPRIPQMSDRELERFVAEVRRRLDAGG